MKIELLLCFIKITDLLVFFFTLTCTVILFERDIKAVGTEPLAV